MNQQSVLFVGQNVFAEDAYDLGLFEELEQEAIAQEIEDRVAFEKTHPTEVWSDDYGFGALSFAFN